MYVWCDSFIYSYVARLMYSAGEITHLSCTHIHALQHTATYYNKRAAFEPRTHVHTLHTLQHTATHCTHCSTLQHTATHYNVLQHTCRIRVSYAYTHSATHCNTLQHTTTHVPHSCLIYICTHISTYAGGSRARLHTCPQI